MPELILKNWNEIADGFRGKYSRWGKVGSEAPERACNRVFNGVFLPEITPKFRLSRERGIFTVGSCFARRIEQYLDELGIPIANKFLRQKLHVNERSVNDGALFNRFNMASIYYEIRSLCEPGWLGDRLIYRVSADEAYDAYFNSTQLPGDFDGKLALRQDILSYQHGFVRQAQAVFVTLGMSEAIFDNQFSLYLNGAPVLGRFNLRNKERFEGHLIGVDETVQMLEDARRILKDFAGPELKMVVTVSPVPLEDTFTGKDVVLANAKSKAILRLAADAFASGHADVDYFPSYEMVTNSAPRTAYARDFRHVKGEMVGAITDHFVRHYFD